MNKRITQKHILLEHLILASCLLFASSQTLADRPAMSERSEILEPEIIEIDTETPVFIEEPALEARPAVDDMPTVEVEVESEIRPEPVVELEAEAEAQVDPEPLLENAEPATQVYEQQTEVTGDVIELQAGDTLPVNIIDFPRRGMTMDKVKNELGQPREASDAIGKPPITIWTYDDRVVYFEYSSVVHVVATH